MNAATRDGQPVEIKERRYVAERSGYKCKSTDGRTWFSDHSIGGVLVVTPWNIKGR